MIAFLVFFAQQGPPATGSRNWIETIALVLGSNVFVAFLTGLFNRKKTSADAAEIITKAAVNPIKYLEGELGKYEKKNDELEIEVSRLATEMRKFKEEEYKRIQAWRKLLSRHEAWDRLAIQKLREASPEPIQLPEPPPLDIDYESGG